jgi:hypothetical protein
MIINVYIMLSCSNLNSAIPIAEVSFRRGSSSTLVSSAMHFSCGYCSSSPPAIIEVRQPIIDPVVIIADTNETITNITVSALSSSNRSDIDNI